jgi:hypothetical protein
MTENACEFFVNRSVFFAGFKLFQFCRGHGRPLLLFSPRPDEQGYREQKKRKQASGFHDVNITEKFHLSREMAGFKITELWK